MRRKWVMIGILILISPVVLLFLFLCFERARGKISLAILKRHLVAQGFKLNSADMATHTRDEDNGARELFAAIAELKPGDMLPNHPPPRMKIMPSGRAVVCSREEEWVDDHQTNVWEDLVPNLKANEATLERIRAAFGKPAFDNHLDYSLGPKMPITRLVPPKKLCNWFGSGIGVALHEGNTHEALPDLLCEVQTPRCLAEDHVVISEMVRIAIADIARVDTWEALQANGWADDDLAKLEQAWAEENFAEANSRALEGEMVFARICIELCRKSNQETYNLTFGMDKYLGYGGELSSWEQIIRNLPMGDDIVDFFNRQVYCRIWRFAWLDQAECLYLQQMRALIKLSRAAAGQKSFAAVSAALAEFSQQNSNKGLWYRMRYPPEILLPDLFGGIVKRPMEAETERSVILCAIALRRYELRHGHPPDSLEALVPEYLPSVPTDYMDGKPMKYRRKPSGGYVLYSVGLDGVDDHGDTSMNPGETMSRGPWGRKDLVWPEPATPEEVEEYRKEAAKN